MEKAKEVIYTSKPALLPNPKQKENKVYSSYSTLLRPLNFIELIFNSWKCLPNSASYSHWLGAKIRKNVSQQGHAAPSRVVIL
jgi:hypothetical protein